MRIETEYVDIIAKEESEEERKAARLFKQGKLWLVWDKEKKAAKSLSGKSLPICLVFKKTEGIEDFARTFVLLWSEGLIAIRYDRKKNDIITTLPKFLKEREGK